MLNIIIKYWIEILFGLIISCVSYVLKQITNYKKRLDFTNEGIIVLLKSKIIEKYNNLIEKDSITIEEKEDLNDLYKVYKKFECCDVITDLVKKINSIRIISK